VATSTFTANHHTTTFVMKYFGEAVLHLSPAAPGVKQLFLPLVMPLD